MDHTPEAQTRSTDPDSPASPLQAMHGGMADLMLATAALLLALPWLGAQTGCDAGPRDAPDDAAVFADAGVASDAGWTTPLGNPVRATPLGDMHGSTRAVLDTLARTEVEPGDDDARAAVGEPLALATGATGATGATATTPNAAGWSADFALVTTGGGMHAMLDTVDATQAVTEHGPLRLADRRSYIVHASIQDAELPSAAERWRGASVEVVTSTGARCRARVIAFEYRVDLIPDDYQVGLWRGERDDDGRTGKRLRGPELARAVWDYASNRAITARLQPAGGAPCAGTPLYARRQVAPPARIARPMAWVPRRAAVMRAFRSLPAYEAAQADYVSGDETRPARTRFDPVRWERYEDAPTVQAFQRDDGVVFASVSVPWGRCGAWGPALWAVYRLRPASDRPPELVVSSTELSPDGVKLILAADAEEPTFVVDDGLAGRVAVMRAGRTVAAWGREFHGCSC